MDEHREAREERERVMTSVRDVAKERVAEMQADWFIREVKRCREIGMPLGCCDEWPECSHVLSWSENRAANSQASADK